MKKAYTSLLTATRPCATVFLGDLFDSAKQYEEADFRHAHARFNWVFADPLSRQSTPTKQLFLSGNHDLGYDVDEGMNARLAARFEETFSPLNFKVRWRADVMCAPSDSGLEDPPHPQGSSSQSSRRTRGSAPDISLVFLSSTTVDEDATHTDPTLLANTRAFVQSFNATSQDDVNILFTHIPLYRDPSKSCGALRRRASPIRNRRGYSYRNMLPMTTSDFIRKHINPSLVLSGDDHDQCHIQHSLALDEFTLGTFSWLQGEVQPVVTLLTLTAVTRADLLALAKVATSSAVPVTEASEDAPPISRLCWPESGEGDGSYSCVFFYGTDVSHAEAGVAVDLTLCSLPQQLRIYLVYGATACLSLCLLAIDVVATHVFLARREAARHKDRDTAWGSGPAAHPTTHLWLAAGGRVLRQHMLTCACVLALYGTVLAVSLR